MKTPLSSLRRLTDARDGRRFTFNTFVTLFLTILGHLDDTLCEDKCTLTQIGAEDPGQLMTTATSPNQQTDPSTMTPLVRRSEALFRALLWLLAVVASTLAIAALFTPLRLD